MLVARGPALLVVLSLVACTPPPGSDDEIGDETDTDSDETDTDDTGTDTGDPACGNGIVDPGEACDDGNQNDADGCLNDCTLPACGDGIVQANEACDDGNQINEDACTNLCIANVCGDGFHWPDSEACDDGNQTDADGCEADCSLPACSNAIVDPGEICYAPGQTLAIAANPVDVDIADIDGDGNLDIVALVDSIDQPLVTWLGDGAGGLGNAISSAAAQMAPNPAGFGVADLDEDGMFDVAYPALNDIIVAWGTSEGSFESPTPIVCPYATSVVIGRFDDEARLDVACTEVDEDTFGTGKLHFARNLGNRSFSDPIGLSIDWPGINYRELVAADMDDDGDDELIVYEYDGLQLWRQTAPGSFELEAHALPDSFGWGLGIGDLDGDARPDAVVSFPDDVQDPTRIFPMLQDPQGMLVAQPSVAAGMRPFGVKITDVSSDASNDVVVALESGAVVVLAGDGTGQLAEPLSFPAGAGAKHVAIGDLDGDAAPELVVANSQGQSVSVIWSDP